MSTGRFLKCYRMQILLIAVLAAAACGGCSTEPENESAKPWNSPEGWGGGNMPLQMMQPH